MADPLGSRVLVIEGGRPRGGTIIGGRERVGEPATIHVKLDPLEEGTAVEYRTLPASEVWIDTAALERWADAETRYRLAEELRRRAEDERELCTCGHPRRAHHAGGVDDGGCTACECTAYADQIERLTRERDEARATDRLWKVCELAYPEEGWTVLEAATAEEAQRQYESSCGGRPDGIEPDEEWLTATPFTLEDLEAMAENERLRGAWEAARAALARLGEGE